MPESKLTVPKPFRFHSDEGPGASKCPDTDSRASDVSDATLAQSLDVLRNGLREYSPKISTKKGKRESKLTVPHAPRLQSDQRAAARPSERSNNIYVPMAQSTDILIKGLRSSKSDDVNDKWESKLTVPQAPRFQSDQRAARKTPQRSEDPFVPLVQSSDVLMRGLRESASADATEKAKWENKRLTVPEAPKFHQAHARPLPRSSEELLEEEMDYFRSHTFKARPLPVTPSTTSPKISPKTPRLTTSATPFHFQSEGRASHSKPSEIVVTKEEIDLEECKKKFHARPMPKFAHAAAEKSPVSQPVAKPTVTPKADFRARPVPKSTYTSPTSSLETTPVKFATSNPLDILEQEIEASPAKPFVLESAVRHEEHQKKLTEKRKQEELEEKRLSQFHARPFKARTPPTIKPVEIKRTACTEKMFQLSSIERHKAFEEERRRKLAEEEAVKRKQSTFKAKPLPKSYNKTEQNIKKKGALPKSKLQQPSSPSKSLNSKKAAAETKAGASGSFTSFMLVFFLCCVLRIANTFLVQSYFDPDEFWQTMEPAYCQAFNGRPDCPGYTWEWTRRPPPSTEGFIEQSLLGPARSYISVLPTYLFYDVLKRFEVDTTWLVSRGPMILAAVTVAAPTDLAVWYTARWLKPLHSSTQKNALPIWCLFCSLSSWFNAYASTRTFANCQETAILAIGVALMSPELVGNVDARFSSFRACIVFLVGGISVALRFTTIAAFVPMGILLALRCRSTLSKLGYLILPCAVFGLAGLALAMAVDRRFFGLWTVPFLGNFHFNVILDRAGMYGTHPSHWYFSTGVPALTGLLLPLLLPSLKQFGHGRLSYGEGNLWTIVLCYLITLSFNAHKELRYIMPVLPLFCLLTGSHVRGIFVGNSSHTSRGRVLFSATLFVSANLIAVLYLGLFHQTGPILVNRSIVSNAKSVARTSNESDFTIHYLTGACHSTPLHSQLHAPPLSFEIHALDCSPECRADPEQICETERFAQDPVAYVEEAYFSSCIEVSVPVGADEEETCLAESHVRSIPGYVVTVSTYEASIRPQLESMGLHEVARFPHHINGAKIGNELVGDSYFLDGTSRHIALASWLEVSLEEMILFSRYKVKN